MLYFPSNVRHVQKLICQTAMDNHSTLKRSSLSSSLSESHSSTWTLQINYWEWSGSIVAKQSLRIALNEVDIVYVFCSWLNSHVQFYLQVAASYVLLVIQCSVGIFLNSGLGRTSFELKEFYSEIMVILFSTICQWHCFCKFVLCYLNLSVKSTTCIQYLYLNCNIVF